MIAHCRAVRRDGILIGTLGYGLLGRGEDVGSPEPDEFQLDGVVELQPRQRIAQQRLVAGRVLEPDPLRWNHRSGESASQKRLRRDQSLRITL